MENDFLLMLNIFLNKYLNILDNEFKFKKDKCGKSLLLFFLR
jgi:hypothetical protein